MKNEIHSTRPDWVKFLLVAVIALLAGAAVSPVMGSAAVALQSVLVKNTSASAVYVQPPSRTWVRVHKSVSIPSGQMWSNTTLYTVPAGKAFVVTSVTFTGEGFGKAQEARFVTSDYSNAIALPTGNLSQSTSPNSYYLGGTVTGETVLHPGAVLTFFLFRDDASTGTWSGQAWVNGYLTAKP